MKPKFKTLLICILFNLNLNAQTWTRSLTTSNSEGEIGIIKSNDGSGALVNVNNVTIGGQNEIVISKLNSDGTLNWSKVYSLVNSNVSATSFIQDRNGDIVIVGSTVSSSVQKGLVLKVNYSTGNIAFVLRTQSGGNGAYFRKVIQLNSGYSDDYVILGTTNYPVTNLVARINSSNGSIIWAHDHNVVLGNTDLWYTLSQINNNEIVIGGGLYNGSNNDHAVIHLNPNTGARSGIKVWNIINGTAANGGFDDAVVIPGTDTIIFVSVQNGGGSVTKHGFAYYDGGSRVLYRAQINSIGTSNSRAQKVDYNPNRREFIIGGVSGASYNDNFVEIVNFDTRNIAASGKTDATINRATFNLGATWVSYSGANEFLVGNTVIPIGSYINGNDVIVSKLTGYFNGCYDSIEINNDTLIIPNYNISTMDSINVEIDSINIELDSFLVYDTLRCESSGHFVKMNQKLEYKGTYENNVFPFPYEGLQKEDLLTLMLYPNPSNGETSLNLSLINVLELETTLEIFDSRGNLVYSQKMDGDSSSIVIDVSQLEKGLYLMKLSSSQNSTFSKFQVN